MTAALSSSFHFISGLPRSGSTLLAALLRQNPRFHAGMTSPLGGLIVRLIEGMSQEEGAVFISDAQKRDILLNTCASFYRTQLEQDQLIFDTNRLWCSKLDLIQDLFPTAKVICCVRNIAWIMDSLERLIRRNTLDVSGLFGNRGEASTVYSRTEALGQGNRLVGFAYNALKEAYYSTSADHLLLVDYELLTLRPAQTMALIYQFLGLEPFSHDFENVAYDEPEFDSQLRTKGLHQVRSRVEFVPRPTILPPDLFDRFSQLSFWADPSHSRAHVIALKPKTPTDSTSTRSP